VETTCSVIVSAAAGEQPPVALAGAFVAAYSASLVRTEIPDHCSSRYVVRVRFGETDLMGIVHHASYLLYFEAARVEYMHRRGVEYLEWAKRGLHLPVVEARVRYKKTARFDERLIIEARLAALTRVTVRFEYRILRDAPGEEVVAEGHTLLACVGDDHAPRRLPREEEAVLLSPETHPRPIDSA
jgi:acyl-CoA thioester hydrolase